MEQVLPPPEEQKRIEALKAYQILDTPPEREFDDLNEITAKIFNAPIAFISLIDTDRQWFKSMKGLPVKETKREYSLCHYAIQTPERITEIPDALKDERFKASPLVISGPKIRYYAGAPLVNSEGVALGTLCIMDKKPKKLSKDQTKILKTLAGRVVDLLELRKENQRQQYEIRKVREKLEHTLSQLVEAQHTAKIGSWDWDIVADTLSWSPEMYRIFQVNEEEKRSLLKVWKSNVHPEDTSIVNEAIIGGLKYANNTPLEYRLLRPDGSEIWVETRGEITHNSDGKTVKIHGTVQDISYRKKADLERQIYLHTLQEMLSDLSHKIRQPLTNCLGLTSAFNMPDLSNEQIQEFVGYLNVSVKKIDEYSREMSEYIYSKKTKIEG